MHWILIIITTTYAGFMVTKVSYPTHEKAVQAKAVYQNYLSKETNQFNFLIVEE